MSEKYLYTTPLDMPRSTHFGNNFWYMPSMKLGRVVTAHSNLEHDNHVRLELDPSVEYYCEQPCKESVVVDGKILTTVFDVYVYYANGRHEMQEVKYSKDLETGLTDVTSRIYNQHICQESYCSQHGIDYAVVTDKDLYTGQFTSRNREYIYGKARRFVPSSEIDLAAPVRFIKEHGSLTIGQLVESGRVTERQCMGILSFLYCKGRIVFTNIDVSPITVKTEVSYAEEV